MWAAEVGLGEESLDAIAHFVGLTNEFLKDGDPVGDAGLAFPSEIVKAHLGLGQPGFGRGLARFRPFASLSQRVPPQQRLAT